MQRAQAVHVGVDVGVGEVEGGLPAHRRVPLGGDPDEGDVGEGGAGGQRGRPGGRDGGGERERI